MQGENHSNKPERSSQPQASGPSPTPIQQQRFGQAVSEKLVRAAQAGDMHAHSEIYRMYAQPVLTLARGICNNPHSAEDVVHNTFVKLIDKIALFEFRAPFGMWLRQIAVNEALGFLRKQKKHNYVSTDEYDFFESMDHAVSEAPVSLHTGDFDEQHGAKLELQKLLAQLPETARMILWLKEVEGYTHTEIAALVDKTPSYSKSVVARTYKFLRERHSPQTYGEALCAN